VKGIKIVKKLQDLIVISKPAGIQTTKSKLDLYSVEEALAGHKDAESLHYNQRIDTPVSGLMTVSTNADSAHTFNHLINTYQVGKYYIAVCNIGDEVPREGSFTDYLIRDGERNKARISSEADPKSKKSIIEYKIVATLDRYHVIRVKLVTGRFHQIRCQLAHRNLWIKDDVKYGARRSNKNKTIYLHACNLEFDWKGEKQTFVSPPNLSDNLWQIAWDAYLKFDTEENETHSVRTVIWRPLRHLY